MPEGQTELELYSSATLPDYSQRENNSWKYQLEIEHGITDYWDVGLYQMLGQKNTPTSSQLTYDGFKLRSRYRIGEKGQYFLDPLLYLEYIKDDDLSEPGRFEAKLILAKDVGRFNIAYNQVAEEEFEGDEKEIESKYALGISYEIALWFRLGIESKGNYSEDTYALGPTVSIARPDFWVSLGFVFGLNKDANDTEVQMLIGIPFH